MLLFVLFTEGSMVAVVPDKPTCFVQTQHEAFHSGHSEEKQKNWWCQGSLSAHGPVVRALTQDLGCFLFSLRGFKSTFPWVLEKVLTSRLSSVLGWG